MLVVEAPWALLLEATWLTAAGTPSINSISCVTARWQQHPPDSTTGHPQGLRTLVYRRQPLI